MKIAYLKTPIGFLKLMSEKNSLVCVKRVLKIKKQEKDLFLEEVKKQLKAYFEKKLQKFDLSFELKGSFFQKKVQKSLLKIPYGKLITYKELSEKAGYFKAYRASASVCAKNPLLIIIPCHRVISSDQSISKYRLGAKNKEFLIDLEKSF